MLRDLADDQGKARVQLAGAMAREDLRRMVRGRGYGRPGAGGTADSAASAGAGAHRCDSADSAPCLRNRRHGRLRRFLRHATDDAERAVRWIGRASSPTARNREPRSWRSPRTSVLPVLGAYASLGDTEGSRVFVVRLLNDKLARDVDPAGRARSEARRLSFFHERSGQRVYSTLFRRPRRRPLGRSANQLARASTPPACRSSLRRARRLLSSKCFCRRRRSTRQSSHLTHKLLVTALILAVLAVFAGVILSELIAGP